MAKNINCSMLLGSVCIGAFVAGGIAQAQEVKNASAAMGATATVTPVSQQQLTNAHKDGTNFLHTNGNYEQTRFYPNAPDQPRQRRASASGLDLLHRSQGVARDVADHR